MCGHFNMSDASGRCLQFFNANFLFFKNTLKLVSSIEATVKAIDLNVYFHILRNTEHTFIPILATDLQSITLEPSAATPAADVGTGKKLHKF